MKQEELIIVGRLRDYFSNGAPSYKVANSAIKASSRIKADRIMEIMEPYTKLLVTQALKELREEVKTTMPVTTVQNIEPLENGQYVKVKNLFRAIDNKIKALEEV